MLASPSQNLQPVAAPQYLPIADSDGNGIPDWQDELTASGIAAATTTPNATSTDPLSTLAARVASQLYGGYLSLKQYDQYTPERGERLAQTVAESIKAPTHFVPHTVDELSLDSDSSDARILRYRSDMRIATAPMVTDDMPEFDMFAQYIATKDSSWLQKLTDAAGRYKEVENNMLAMQIPTTAVPEHLRAVNALGAYVDALTQLAQPEGDAFGEAALIKTYNDAEEEMLFSFDALAKYYVRTLAQK